MESEIVIENETLSNNSVSSSPSLPSSFISTIDTLKLSDAAPNSVSKNDGSNKTESLTEPGFTELKDPNSVSDVHALLSKAYDVIAEKEQELDQAFNLRRMVLEENAALKSECEKLKDTLTGPTDLSPKPPSQKQSRYPHSVLKPSPSDDTPYRARHSLYNFAPRNDDQSLLELEQLNASLQKRLDQVLAEKTLIERNGRKENRSLLNEIEVLKQEIETSQKKIKELEESNVSLTFQKRATFSQSEKSSERRSSCDPAPVPYGGGIDVALAKSKLSGSKLIISPELQALNENESKDLSLRLMESVAELEKANRKLTLSQRAAEDQAKSLQLELDNLRVYVSELERNVQHSEQNQFIIDQQAKQIIELMARLEPRQGNFLSQFFSPHSSISSVDTAFIHGYQNTPSHSVKRIHTDNRFSSAKGHRRDISASSAAAGRQPRRTLLSELEGEFYRHFNGSTNRTDVSDWLQKSAEHSSASTPVGELGDLDERPEEQLTFSSETAPSSCLPMLPMTTFPPQTDEKEHIPLIPRPRAGPTGIVNTVRGCVNSVWKWCRFMALLFAAVGVAFYRGPDADITDYYYD